MIGDALATLEYRVRSELSDKSGPLTVNSLQATRFTRRYATPDDFAGSCQPLKRLAKFRSSLRVEVYILLGLKFREGGADPFLSLSFC